MKITPIASSSAGIATIVSNGGSSLLLDCGISKKRLRRALGALTAIDAVLLTHEHADHARGAAAMMIAGVDVFATAGTFEALNLNGHHRARIVEPETPFRVGPWSVVPLPAVHNAAEPVYWYFSTDAATSCSTRSTPPIVRHRFAGLTHVLIEANWCPTIVQQRVKDGTMDASLAGTVLKNHMSIDGAVALLKANDLSAVQGIWLLHLSDKNSDAEAFAHRVAATTGKPVHVAPRNEERYS